MAIAAAFRDSERPYTRVSVLPPFVQRLILVLIDHTMK